MPERVFSSAMLTGNLEHRTFPLRPPDCAGAFPRSEAIQGNMESNPVTLSLLQTEERRQWPRFLLASSLALQREIWGVEQPAATAAGASEDAVGEGLRLGPGNTNQAK